MDRTGIDGAEEMRDLVRSFHMHFVIAPEYEDQGGRRVRVGHRLLLWGVHQKRGRPTPGCPSCVSIFRILKTTVFAAMAGARMDLSDLEPIFVPALYDEPALGRDAVLLTLRLVPRAPSTDDDQTESLAALRRALREMGVPESRDAAR